MVNINREEETPWIIILTHGRSGEELVKSAEMILGPLKNIYALSLLPGMSPEKYKEKITKVLDLAPDGSVIMVDLFGGTPSNIAAMLSRNYKISAVAGINIAMLIEADSLRKTLRGERLSEKIILTAKDSCKNIIKELEKKQTQSIV